MTVKSRLTVAEFDEMVSLPENADRRLEFIGGEVIEVVSNNYSSEIAARILAEIGAYIKGKNLGRVTGADGGYIVSGERYIPDVAFISRAKQPESSHAVYNPNAPDLAVEVLSPSDMPGSMTDKVVGYLAAGTLVWIIDPDKQQAKVYQSGQPPKTVDITGTLDGGQVLPGFTLSLRELFADQ